MNRTGWGIKPLKQTRIPQRHIVLTALPTLAGDRDGYRESWRVAATETWIRTPGDRPARHTYGDVTPERLWREVGDFATSRGVTFCWTYDLTRVTRITDALTWLPRHGWELRMFSLRGGAPWMVWRRGRAVLKIVDTMSLWPDGFDRVAELFGMGRTGITPNEIRAEKWNAAVTRDREILRTAVSSYLEWIRTEDLGNLAVTGNGQAWAAFRRRFLTHGIMVHDDSDLHAMEREAMWTGRAEAYWHGAIGVATVTEWDFSQAHAQLSHDLDVPVMPHGPVDPTGPITELINHDGYALLAEVSIVTRQPVVPMRLGEHIVWPIGEFTTTLWEPEIEEAISAGCRVTVLRGWQYRTAPALRAWARWGLDQTKAGYATTPAWRREIVRRWLNALVGRFAMRFPRWEELGRGPDDDVRITPLLDSDTGDLGMLMQVGRVLWQQDGEGIPHNHAPMITGFVMSAMRAKLWRILSAMPWGTVLYVDTDSMLVTPEGNWHAEGVSQTPAGTGLRRKRSWDGMAIYGPRQIVTGDHARVAGLPRGAKRTGRHEWAGEVTESLEKAMQGRSPGAVRSHARTWEITGTDPRRQSTGLGWTRPIVVGEGVTPPGPTKTG